MQALRVDEAQLSHPPYNIEKTGEDSYRITMAVAGFGQDDISIVSQENSVTISGKAQECPRGLSISIAASPGAPSSAASSSPTISRSRVRSS